MRASSRFVIRLSAALLGLGLLTLCALVGATIWLSERANVYFESVANARDTRGSAVELRDGMRTAESSERGYILTGNEIYLAPYDTAKTAALRQLETLTRKLEAGADTKPMLRRLSDVTRQKFSEMDRTIALKGEHKDADASMLFQSNRGKALMDEANVFVSGIILSADEALGTAVEEQLANATMLRAASILGAVVIVLVVGGVVLVVSLYAREAARARDDVRVLNTSLEQRVAERTADLARARDRAEVLLAEVNHRVANSLTLVASLVKLQSRTVADQSARGALAEAQSRIHAVSLIHQRLYSSGDVRQVALDEYLPSLLHHLETSMKAEGHGATLRYDIEALRLPTDTSVNLGVVVAEWVTNAFKYAYPDRAGEIRVALRSIPENRAELSVEDDGIGLRPNAAARGTGLGSRIVRAMATTMAAETEYLPGQPGTRARLVFAISAA